MSASPAPWPLRLAWTVFGLLCAAWIFVEPYRPEVLIRALPQATVFYTQHENLGDRWRRMAAHPLVAAVAEATGEDPDRFQRKVNDSGLDGWIRRLAGTRTHFAFSPSFGRFGETAWVGSSWVGGKAAFFRLWLSWVGIKGYAFVGRHNGRAIWEIDTQAGEHDPVLRICLAEGQLVVVSSRDPGAIAHALDGLDGLVPSLLADRTGRRAELARWAEGAPDAGYYFLPNMPEYGPAFFKLPRLDEGGFRFTARMLWPYGGGTVFQDRSADLARLLGDLPQAVVALPQRTFGQVLLQRPGTPLLDEFAGMILTNAMPFASLALFEGEFGGSHRGVKVPMLLAALPMESESAALAAAHGFVAAANARVPFAWVGEPADPDPARRLFALTGTVKSKYSKWEGDERAGYAVWNNWLLLSTHTGALRGLLNRASTAEAEFESTRAGWRAGVGADARGVVALRADRLGRAAGAWAQAYGLKLQLKDPEKVAAWAPFLDATRRWSRVLEFLGTANLSLREEQPWLTLDWRSPP